MFRLLSTTLIPFNQAKKIQEENLYSKQKQNTAKKENSFDQINTLTPFYTCVYNINKEIIENKNDNIKVKCEFLYPNGAEKMKIHLKESGYLNAEIYWKSERFCSACYGCYDKLYSLVDITL